MPFCPDCGGEFEARVMSCPDCGTLLVAELLPEEEPERDEPLVQVGSYPSEPMALMWAEVLERNGIGVVVKAGGLNIGGVLNAPVADYRLLVLRSQRRRATRLLDTASHEHSRDYDYRV